MTHQNPGALQYIIPLLIIVPILLLRMRRMSKPRRLKLGLLWIQPAIILVAGTLALFVPQPGVPPHHLVPTDWLWFAGVAIVGAVAGWYMGKTQSIEVHPEDGTLMAGGNMAGVLIIVALVAIKMGLRPLLAAEGGAGNLVLITDCGIIFSLALYTTRSVEMFLRARRVMAAGTTAAFD